MNWPSKKEVKKLREKYPEGTAIRLIKMDDPHPIPSGTIGIIDSVDDIGNIHCRYLNYHSSLAIVPSKDQFEIIKEQYCTDCFFMFYHDEENFEDMDCWNHNALPENGAPEIISSEPNSCPYFEWRDLNEQT